MIDAPRLLPEQTPFEFKRPAWQAKAACRPDVIPEGWQEFGAKPVEVFFPETRGHLSKRRTDFIQSVCGACPVRAECDDHSVRHEDFGVWAGEHRTYREGQRRLRGITVRTLEIDPDNLRKVIGTFFEPPHGSDERYHAHRRAGQEPCEMCRIAHTDTQTSQRQRRNHERGRQRSKATSEARSRNVG